MSCDFFQDECGEIWLFHAADILVRPTMKSRIEIKTEEQLQKQFLAMREKKEELEKLKRAEWKEHELQQREEKKQRRNMFTEQVNQLAYFKQMRKVRQVEKEARERKVIENGK